METSFVQQPSLAFPSARRPFLQVAVREKSPRRYLGTKFADYGAAGNIAGIRCLTLERPENRFPLFLKALLSLIALSAGKPVSTFPESALVSICKTRT
jgi:hypothetical protein